MTSVLLLLGQLSKSVVTRTARQFSTCHSDNGEVLRATIKGGEYSEYSATSQSLVGRSASLKPSSGGVEVVEFVEFI